MGHIHEKIDFTVSVYIVRNGTVLLHKHRVLGIWLPPGGHIELDEDPNEAAVREAKEETGLDVTLVGETREYAGSPYGARELIPPRFLNRHFFDTSKMHEHVNLSYFAHAQDGEARPEDESGIVRWFSREDIEALGDALVPDVKEQALTALAEA